MIDCSLKIDETYSESQIESVGLISKRINDISSKVFVKNNEVYFFEDLSNNKLRLFSVINKRSFFL